MYRECTCNNTLNHIRELVIDASLIFSDTNPDVRTPVQNRPISLAGQNTENEIGQWRKTLYIAPVTDGMHASVSSVKQQRLVLHNSELW